MALRRWDWPALVTCISLPLMVGAVSGYATSRSVDTWYAGLAKPPFNPPNAVFGPVWTLLYVLMGVTLFQLWRSPSSRDRTRALAAFGVQLALTFAWSFLFFRFHLVTAAFAEILVLLACIAAMIALSARVKPASAWLQAPYLLWVSFAAVLNGAIRALNPGL
jgi:translocator protein